MLVNLTPDDSERFVYRIISLDRLRELFNNRENVMVKPKMWDDPFENFILRSKVRQPTGQIIEYNFHESMYGQCWSLHKASDAMWRIYSQDKLGVRIRTTIGDLISSLARHHGSLPQATCAIGKVSYLSTKDIERSANHIFDDSGISVENIFRSLLFKRKAFKHENEIRLLYCEITENKDAERGLYKYEISPNELISQIMIDPRLSKTEAQEIKLMIKDTLNFKGEVKRSMLYAAPQTLTVGTSGLV